MTTDDIFGQFFSRENLLRGSPPTRRAKTILFQIENLTIQLSEQARRAMDQFVTDESVREQNLAFIDAYNLGSDVRKATTVQNLERHAPRWAHLVPQRTELRAAIAHEMAAKYTLRAQFVPAIRQALDLDSELVQDAYQRFYDAPLQSLYTQRVSVLESARWAWKRLANRLDNLPQFWSVFALTLTETVGASLLALPIALAGVGPIPGIMFLLLFGVANVLTVGYMAESASRSGSIRYGNGFLGQMVSEYLGRSGSILLSLGMLVLCLLAILAFYVGFATTLTNASGVPAVIWVAVLYAIGLYFVTRGSINATVTLALVVGAVNLLMIAILIVLTIPHMNLEYVTYVHLPMVGGAAFDASILGLIFGVIFAAFFGHLSVPNSATMVLRRDPTARSLIRGAMAAQVVAIVVNSIWVLVVNGTIAPDVLAAEKGTALIPLAATVGPAIYLFGTVFVVLGLGIVSIHLSLGLFNLTREWLPVRKGILVALPRRQGRLHFFFPNKPAEFPQISLTYLGLVDDKAQFRLDIETGTGIRRVDLDIEDAWDAVETFAGIEELGEWQERLSLTIQRLTADGLSARLRIKTGLTLRYIPGWDRFGLSTTDILNMPDDQAELVSWMMREEPVSLEQVAAHLELPLSGARSFVEPLIEQGALQNMGGAIEERYKVRLTGTRSKRMSDDLTDIVAGRRVVTTASASAAQEISSESALLQGILDKLFGDRGRFILALVPVTLVFLTTELLIFTGQESFSGPLSFIGVVVVAMIGGMFPVLLLRATRPSGDVMPSFFYRKIGHPVLLIAIYLLSLTGVILHGLFIWEDPAMRIAALVVSALIILMTFGAWRQGAFSPRFVATLRAGVSKKEASTLSLTYNGKPLDTTVHLTDLETNKVVKSGSEIVIDDVSQLRKIVLELPSLPAKEIKIWAHQIAESGESQALAVTAGLNSHPPQRVRLAETAGRTILNLDKETNLLELSMDKR